MAKLIAESELRSMNAWLMTFDHDIKIDNRNNKQDFEM